MAHATGSGDGDEPPLNEDDDDDEDDFDDLDQEEEEPNTQHLVLALFDKASQLSISFLFDLSSYFC